MPYLTEMFSVASKGLALTGKERLLDVACGTGKLAFGLSPYVATLTGVDMELPMLEEARRLAAANGININLIHSRLEDMPDDVSPFDLVTIGKAHWFLNAATAIPKLDVMLAKGGRIVICGAYSRSTWQATFSQMRKKWSSRTQEKSRISPDEFFAGSNFTREGVFALEQRHAITLQHAVNRALAFPGTTLESLGDKVEAFSSELKQSLSPYLVNGQLRELQMNTGHVYRRKAGL